MLAGVAEASWGMANSCVVLGLLSALRVRIQSVRKGMDGRGDRWPGMCVCVCVLEALP